VALRRNGLLKFMHQKALFLIAAIALVAAPQFALANGDGAVTGVGGE
jgi:hypothetical protein